MAIERIVPGTKEWDAYYANHISRYVFAANHLSFHKHDELSILDAACGVGYGSNYLASKLKCKITAIDRSSEALNIAIHKFNNPSISFLQDDCHTLEASSAYGTYDAIVSFETLEHLPHPDHFLYSCYKNLNKNGFLIISTPNQLVSSPEGILEWEYHEKEYQPKELIELLSLCGFSDIKLYGQQMTAVGKLRSQFRAELNRVNSNPFVRFGRVIQKVLKGHQDKVVLPEQLEDFEFVLFDSPDEINNLSHRGPFVLIAVCVKL